MSGLKAQRPFLGNNRPKVGYEAVVIAKVDADLKMELLRKAAHELVPYSDIVRAALEEKFAIEREQRKKK